ncbi:MAG: hypothetical protein ACP5N7_01750, partial [Candidatus Pacearchaeota archaeon]
MANDVSFDVAINGLTETIVSVNNLTKSLVELGNKTKKASEQTDKIPKSINGITDSFRELKSIALGAAAALGLAFGGKAIIDAAIEQEDSINKLNTSLEQAGIYSKQTSDSLLEFAATLQNTTKYSEDAVISNLNLLTSLTNLDEQGLKKASKASLDLAARLGIDIDTATQMVTKSINGNSTALQKNGIMVKKGANE